MINDHVNIHILLPDLIYTEFQADRIFNPDTSGKIIHCLGIGGSLLIDPKIVDVERQELVGIHSDT